MKLFRVKSLVGALAAVFCSAAVTQAAMVNYTVVDSLTYLGAYDVKIDTTEKKGAYIGGIQLELAAANPSFPSPYVTVCTDILGTLYLGKTYGFDAVAFSGQTGINPNWGFTSANAADAIQNAAYLFNTYAPSNKEQWQAMQLAVWEVLYDTGNTGGFNLEAGRFSAAAKSTTDPVISLANTWLSSIPSSFDQYTGLLLKPNETTQHGAVAQALLLTSSSTPVPEPSTIIAGLLLLVPLGMGTAKLLRRRVSA